MAKLFQVKLKVFEPNSPMVKFKPAIASVLVATNNKQKAIELASNEFLAMVHKKFPRADVKLFKCTPISYEHFINAEKGGKSEN